jgi:hypothetical protein
MEGEQESPISLIKVRGGGGGDYTTVDEDRWILASIDIQIKQRKSFLPAYFLLRTSSSEEKQCERIIFYPESESESGFSRKKGENDHFLSHSSYCAVISLFLQTLY